MSPADSCQIVGRYAIFGKIASGGMASVHFGRLLGEAGFSRTVAIKRLHPHLAEDDEFRKTLIDEARMVARIHHPNVVPTLDVVDTEGELLLVMEYVRGESVSRLLAASVKREEATPLPIVSAIGVAALHGLHAAHEATDDGGKPLDIVHRDISPQNILVGVDGMIRVIDFGVAKAAKRLQTTQEGTIKGKLAYMAPEQLRGTVTRATDVYAASVVLWEALTGRRLFDGENEGHLFAVVAAGCSTPPSAYAPDIPPALDAVAMRGLSVDPAARFATASEMACCLEEALPHVPASKIGRWVERAAKDSLDQRSAKIAVIESDSSLATPVHLGSSPSPSPSSGAAAVGPVGSLRRAPSDRLPASIGALDAPPTLAETPIAVTDDMLTQLSSGSISSPGRALLAGALGAGRPRAWSAVALVGVVVAVSVGILVLRPPAVTVSAPSQGAADGLSAAPPAAVATVPGAAPGGSASSAAMPSTASAAVPPAAMSSVAAGPPRAQRSAAPVLAAPKAPLAGPCKLVKTLDKNGEAHFACPCTICQ
jgi:serine/threonine-protein kinase